MWFSYQDITLAVFHTIYICQCADSRDKCFQTEGWVFTANPSACLIHSEHTRTRTHTDTLTTSTVGTKVRKPFCIISEGSRIILLSDAFHPATWIVRVRFHVLLLYVCMHVCLFSVVVSSLLDWDVTSGMPHTCSVLPRKSMSMQCEP